MSGKHYSSYFEKPLLKRNEHGVARITIEGASGYVPVNEAYHDTITITPASITYEVVPQANTRLSRSWAYETNSLCFEQAFYALTADTCYFLRLEDMLTVNDADTVTITADFADGHTESRTFCLLDDFFDDYFESIRQLIPACEETPLTLITCEDEPDDDDAAPDDRK